MLLISRNKVAVVLRRGYNVMQCSKRLQELLLSMFRLNGKVAPDFWLIPGFPIPLMNNRSSQEELRS